MMSLKVGCSTLFILFLYSVLVSLAPLTLAVDVYLEHNCTDTGGNFTPNSPYQVNLNDIVSQLSYVTEFSNGFYNLSAGESPDNVSAIALCTADITKDECISCLNYTVNELRGFCPWNKESIAWSEFCMVRYANRDLFGKLEKNPRKCASSPKFAPNPDQFNAAVSELLDTLSINATAGNPLRKYAAYNQIRAGFDMVYAMVQCTPDLDDRSCSSCLSISKTELLNCCSGKIGCRDLSPSCILRFESYPFYHTADSPPSPPSSPTTSPTSPREGIASRLSAKRISLFPTCQVIN